MKLSLVGMPGCGKTTVGRHLARQLSLRFFDSDHEIESRIGMPIRDFFASDGEAAFREIEQDVILSLCMLDDAVIATGGGAVLRPSTRAALHANSHVFYLRNTAEELHRRLRNDSHRPLLQVENPLARLRELFRERDPLYRRTAHFVVEAARPSVPALLSMVMMQLELAGIVDPLQVPATNARNGHGNARLPQVYPQVCPSSPHKLVAMTTPAPSQVEAICELTVKTAGGRYPIRIGGGLLRDPAAWRDLPQAEQAVIVSNPPIDRLYGQALQAALAQQHRQISRVLLPDGEVHKTWDSLNTIFDHLLASGCDRRTVLYALGGGVVGDITGLAAATYMRGVPFVQVPTTLLAQVDSSVGGKTAINHPRGKNMIGAFHQPALVVCDLATLDTLPARELSAGLAEVIKYGPIADTAFLGWIEEHLDALLARDRNALAHAVRRSCEIKAGVVGEDEREAGLRAILNFGHTFGHAIEAGLGYGEWLHGEAVGCGMVLAAALSAELGMVDADFADRLRALIARASLPVQAPPLPMARWFELMRGDKKSEAGEIRFVVLDGPGRALVRAAPDALVQRVIERHTAPAGSTSVPAAASGTTTPA